MAAFPSLSSMTWQMGHSQRRISTDATAFVPVILVLPFHPVDNAAEYPASYESSKEGPQNIEADDKESPHAQIMAGSNSSNSFCIG